MILDLMDIRYLRRFLILDHLHKNQNHSIELMELVKLLNVSYPTVKKIITEIKLDIQELGYDDHVELVDLFEPKKVIWNVKINFSTTIFRLHYLEQSYRFQLFSLFIEPKEWTISEITKKLNITYAMVKREILYLERYIQLYASNLTLKTKRKLALLGDEATIRLLYTGIYQHVYGGYKWPFLFTSTYEILDILNVLDESIYQKFSARFLTIHYGLAISLLRAKKSPIPANDYYWKPMTDADKKMYDNFVQLLRKKRAIISTDILKTEARFAISCIIATSMGQHDGKLPTFFSNSSKLHEIDFLHRVNEKLKTIEEYALREMTCEERETTFARLVGVFYQILIYKKGLQQRIVDLYVHHPFEFPGNKERERTFYEVFMNKSSKNLTTIESEYLEYLCVAYYKILFFELNRQLFHPKIYIYIVSNRAPEMLASTKLQMTGNYFCIEIVNFLSEETDLILTDMALSNQIKFYLTKNVPILYMNEAFCARDNELLQEELTRIADIKYRKLKNEIEDSF